MKHLRDILFLSAVLLMLPLGSMRAENADEMLDYECVDTIAINSTHLQTTVKAVVIVPSQYFDAEMQEVQFPVLYLLHGFGDNYAKWTITDPELADMATEYGTIIVCPDGLKSWYIDSPMLADSQMESFFINELIPCIDSRFRTLPERDMRAITGLSMGGHGALWLAFRHPDVFASAGSMSGGVDIVPFPGKWNLDNLLGKQDEHLDNWKAHSVINLVPLLSNGKLNIIFDCGYDDFFFEVNNRLHEALLQQGIGHDFIVRPGNHSWKYWTNSIDYQMLFFAKCFERAAMAE